MMVLWQNLQQAASDLRYRAYYAATWHSSAAKVAWARIPRPPYAASSLAALTAGNSERVVRGEPPLNLVAPAP